DGTLLSKETYKYEFDFAGNWNKMTTAVAVVDSGKVSFEPTEVTYRSIMYYLDENMVKMVQPGAQPTSPATPANTVAKNSETRAPLSSNKSSNKSVSPVLPTAQDRVNDVESAEPRALAGNTGTTQQRVVMDSEPPSPTFKANLKPVSGG